MLNPGFLPPLPDEGLASWLIRNSFAQGTDPMGFAGGVWPDIRPWTRDQERQLSPEEMRLMHRVSGLSPEAVAAMTLEPSVRRILGGITPQRNKAWPWVVPRGIRNRTIVNGSFFCPECLREKHPYLRKSWRFSWHISCTRHEKLLHSGCPGCGQVFSPHLADFRYPSFRHCTRCGLDLSGLKGMAPARTAFLLQKHLDEALAGTEDPVELFAFFRDAFHLARNARRGGKIFDAILEASGVERGSALDLPRKSGTVFDGLEIRHCQTVMLLAAPLLADGGESARRILAASGATFRTVAALCPLTSRTMRGVTSGLEYGEKRVKNPRNRSPEPVSPSSREEVEQKMQRLRVFLK